MATPAEINRLADQHGSAADALFLQLMLRHHEGGVQMANYAAGHASIPQVRALASEMAVDQSQEIGLMRNLLAAYDAQPLPFPG